MEETKETDIYTKTGNIFLILLFIFSLLIFTCFSLYSEVNRYQQALTEAKEEIKIHLEKEKLFIEFFEMQEVVEDIKFNDSISYCQPNIYQNSLKRKTFFVSLFSKNYIPNNYLTVLINTNQKVIDVLKHQCNFNNA
jgi:hypothetical protein